MFEAAGLNATTVWRYDEKEHRWASQQASGTLPFSLPVYDSSTGQALFFGLGETIGGPITFFDQLYSFDPAKNAWSTSSPPQNAPSPRIGPALAYDPAVHQVVMFGGAFGPGEFNETWTYDTDTGAWTNRKPKGAVPSGRMGENLVCDDSTGKVYMLGGIPQQDGGTWSYDPKTNRWTDLHATGDVPTALGGSAAALVPSLHEIVVFGGSYGTYFSDTWAYDIAANRWRNLHPTGAVPAARSGALMVYDPARQEIVMVGGEPDDRSTPGDIWTYDPAANRWTNLLSDGDAPLTPRAGALFYAGALGSVVMVSGRIERSVTIDGTWELGR
jgi:N-acetylneuraminic acid mutarotase